MKKKLLLLAFIIFCLKGFSQNTTCEQAVSLCGSLGQPFSNTVNVYPDENDERNYGCFAQWRNPFWFYLPVSQSGDLNFIIKQHSLTGNEIDVDYICYGPFNSVEDGCNDMGTTIFDCSYSANSTETLNVPNAQAGEYYLLLVTNYENVEGYITINDAASEGIMECSGIRLNAFLDSNNNNILDAGEKGFNLGEFIYEQNPGGLTRNGYAPNGIFTIYDEDINNTYNITYQLLPEYAPYYSVSVPSYSNIQISGNIASETYYFPVTVAQDYNDLSVTLIPTEPPLAGFDNKIVLHYINKGSQPISGTITFEKDPVLSISSISQTGATITPTGFEYNFSNLEPYNPQQIVIDLYTPVIPTVNLGDSVTNSALITLDNDIFPLDNTSELTQIIVGSYDPNDKFESHGKQINIDEFNPDDYLYYTIRFQNTGTANARTVVIQDELADKLIYESVEMIRSSHSYVMERMGNNLTWTFSNIQLPPEGIDPEGSNGYVHFRVKPVAGITAGDEIQNTAYIYFDFNPAIVTNTFITQFVDALSINDVKNNAFTVYPNPADNIINVNLIDDSLLKALKIYDITGKLLIDKTDIPANNFTIDVSGLSPGTYLIEAAGSNSKKVVKKLIVN
jgi:uncharacterized repeat protein (TIGR01451 family)